MFVTIEPPFATYANAAATRLRYLFPTITFEVEGDGIRVDGPCEIDEAALQQEIHYALYREKIYAETLSLRRSLIEAVTSK